MYYTLRHPRILPQVSVSKTKERASSSAAAGQTGGGSSLEIQKDAQMTKESCGNRTVLCPICLCEYLHMCVFVFSTSLTIGFANILIALVQILEEGGQTLQYRQHD